MEPELTLVPIYLYLVLRDSNGRKKLAIKIKMVFGEGVHFLFNFPEPLKSAAYIALMKDKCQQHS